MFLSSAKLSLLMTVTVVVTVKEELIYFFLSNRAAIVFVSTIR